MCHVSILGGCQHSTQGWAVPELQGPCWGGVQSWQLPLSSLKSVLLAACYLPGGCSQVSLTYHLCLLRWWDLLSELLSKSPQRRDARVSGTRYAGKTSWGLEVGREREKKTKEAPPSVELKPVVVLCLARIPHCTVLGSCSPLADALPRAMRSVLQRWVDTISDGVCEVKCAIVFGAIVSVFNIEVTHGFQGTIYQTKLTGCREDVDYENRGIKFHTFGAEVSFLS